MAFMDFLVQIKEGLTGLGSAVTNGVLGFFSLFGINIPPILVQLVLIGMVLLFFWKWATKLPWFILLILGLFLAAFLMNMFSGI